MTNIDRANIEADCGKIITALAHLVDQGRYDELCALYTEDGQFHRPGLSANSREEILAFMRSRPADVVTRHVCTAPFFEKVTADTAASVTYLTLYHSHRAGDGPAELSPPVAIAELHDQFRRTDAGWRIASRKVKVALVGKS